jgi:SAM-dependent methyltransferase
VNRAELSAVMHGDVPFANPLDPLEIERAVASLPLPSDGRAVDIGCGAGRLLELVKQHHRGMRTVGVEPSPAWARAARERGVDVVHEARLDDVSLAPASFGLVCCLASSHAIGPWDEALRTLLGWTTPGGYALLGEGFWRREPSDGYLAALGGATRDELPARPELIETAREVGWQVEAETIASGDDWARYEETLIANGERHLETDPDPDLAAWLGDTKARWNHPDGRDTLGFALLTLRSAAV